MLASNSYARRGRYAGSTTSPATGSSGTFLVRPRLPLRSHLRPKSSTNIPSFDAAGYGRSKRFKSRKFNGFQKMDATKKKSPDYTEMAYREAVSKLKYLLAESYTPRMAPRKLLHGGGTYLDSNPKIQIESGEDTDDRSGISDGSHAKGLIGNLPPRSSPYLPRPKNSQLARACSNLAMSAGDPQSAPPELMSFIERQEEYIEQLERESQYCRDELTNLFGKVREVVAENEELQDKSKNGFLKSVLEEFNNSEEENQEPDERSSRVNTLENKGKRVKLQRVLEGPSIVFESRISELEAQLTQARVELRKAQEENQANMRRLSESGVGDGGPETKNQLDRAFKEKREAEMKLEELQRNLAAARDREADTAHKAKRALDVVEQAQFEKTQADAEIRRLRDELERQHERLREAAQESIRRVAEERHQVERRYSQQIEQLSADVASHWDAASKSQLEAEKQRREITDLRRDLTQKQSLIDDLKKELQSKISSMQSELSQAVAEKDAAEQEVSAAKMSNERAERQARQDQNRMQSEINSYKQRSERADADLVHCRRENLRLSEQIASLEKEISLNKMVRSEENRTPGATPRPENDKELTSMIMDMETKHAATVAGLEGAMANQATLVSQLTTECQSLTQRLEANSLKHKEEMASLQNNIEYLTTKIQDTLDNRKAPPKQSYIEPEPRVYEDVPPYEIPGTQQNQPLELEPELMNEPEDNISYERRIAGDPQDEKSYDSTKEHYIKNEKPEGTYKEIEDNRPENQNDNLHSDQQYLQGNQRDDLQRDQQHLQENQKDALQSDQQYLQRNQKDDLQSDQKHLQGNQKDDLQSDQHYLQENQKDDLQGDRQYLPPTRQDQNHHPERDEQYAAQPEEQYDPQNPPQYDSQNDNAANHQVYDQQNTEQYGTQESDPTDNQNYETEYADQEYNQYDQYDPNQYQQEQYAEGGQYESQEPYQEMQYNEQEYQNYPSNYEDEQHPQQTENIGESQIEEHAGSSNEPISAENTTTK